VKSRFITFEGIDGAGKSSQIAAAVALIQSRGIPVVQTREPGGTPLGEKLRELLLHEPMHLETEALLMFAARREHLAARIEPALAAGAWVVSDRFTDATYAYQVGGSGLDEKRFAALEKWVHPHLQPDLTLIFDLDPQVAARRLAGAGQAPIVSSANKPISSSGFATPTCAGPLPIRQESRSSTPLRRPDEIRKELEQIILEICFQ
jgi:dTMP kinase